MPEATTSQISQQTTKPVQTKSDSGFILYAPGQRQSLESGVVTRQGSFTLRGPSSSAK